MNLNTAQWLAESLMKDHGLDGWTFTWDRATRRAGVCRYSTRTISLSRPIAELNDEDEVRDTILHEIAHALVGSIHKHDYVWQAKARAIGCSGNRTTSAAAPEGRWVAICPNHGQIGSRFQKPSLRLIHGTCKRCKSEITWLDKQYATV